MIHIHLYHVISIYIYSYFDDEESLDFPLPREIARERVHPKSGGGRNAQAKTAELLSNASALQKC